MASNGVNSLLNYSNILNYSNYNSYTNYGSKTTKDFNYSPTSQYGQNDSATSAKTQDYLAGIKKYSNQLKDASDKMRSSIPPVFDAMVAVSEKADAVSVQVDKSVSKDPATVNVDVKQVATAQTNEGTSQNADTKTTAQAGTNSLSIGIGGKTFSIDVNISSNDSNRNVQQKMADAINKQDTGVKASVQYDAKTKKSALVLASKDTGEKNAFTVNDTKGDLVQSMNLASTKQEAKDAVYSVNGKDDITSSSNTVSIEKGITAVLKKVTDGDVKVSTKKDTNSIVNSIYDVVNNINGLMETAKNNGSDKGAQSLVRQLSGAVLSSSYSLDKIGISKDKNGYVTVDTDKLKKSIDDGSAERVLGKNESNRSYSFVGKVQQIASSVDSNPSAYLSNSSKNAKAPDFSSYQRFMMQQSTGTGLLFSSLF